MPILYVIIFIPQKSVKNQKFSRFLKKERDFLMMRGIYKKLFAEFFPRNLPMEDFAVPSRKLAEK